ncbi:hypothetical protein BAY61_21880 [Prauserella marina]|uniref:Major Facilitator Superfamily protein n=1 Tax=Prauserella marina TaxID=530584 RepID=A0A222VTE1_9PSEU|nr:hypothetical protein BAY61_21880 [Prauserella marina]PWV72522.1 MFS transporter [Prauserella marina]SDD78031.1 Major Facilitator Superfamily protein [Prauserella marina]
MNLIDAGLRRVRTLWTGAGVTALYMASAGSSYYLLTLLLQHQWHYGAREAGFGFLPLAAAVSAGSAVVGGLARRCGLTRVLVIGFALCAGGLAWLAATAPGGSYVLLVTGLVVSGIGNGLVFAAMFLLGTRDVRSGDEGTAGGVLATSQYLSSTVALALLTVLIGPERDSRLPTRLSGLERDRPDRPRLRCRARSPRPQRAAVASPSARCRLT